MVRSLVFLIHHVLKYNTKIHLRCFIFMILFYSEHLQYVFFTNIIKINDCT